MLDISSIDPRNPMGREAFEAIARVSTSIACEATLMRRNRGKLEVFLTQREPGEAYGGQWHIPGSVKRPYEKYEQTFERIGSKEYGSKITGTEFFGEILTSQIRGAFICRVYLIELEGEPTLGGRWVDVDRVIKKTSGLPIVDVHEDLVIPLAEKAFKYREAKREFENLRSKLCEE